LKLSSSEFELIEKYFKPLAPRGEPAYALSNDGAIFTPSMGKKTVYTVDTLVSGIHFFENDNPEIIAKKALRVNLSDLAAMAAKPAGYLLSIALPKELNSLETWIKNFARGLAEDQAKFNIQLWGGDTVSTTGPITISITAIGEIDPDTIISRSGAKIGDHIYVSGTLGDAAAGLRLIREGNSNSESQFLIERYNLPLPRLELSEKIVSIATSMMDISDGLMGDISHICRHSQVGAAIEQKKIPISIPFGNLLATKTDYSDLSWCGGDDYELLFTTDKKNDQLIRKISDECCVKLTSIGKITDGHIVKLLDDEGKEITTDQKGFRHF
jgi:thiamine-monophosphate kinase